MKPAFGRQVSFAFFRTLNLFKFYTLLTYGYYKYEWLGTNIIKLHWLNTLLFIQ